MVNQLGSVGLGGPGALAQHLGVLGDDDGQLEAGIGVLEALDQIPGIEIADASNGAISVTWWVSGSSQRS